MKITYDAEAKALYLRLNTHRVQTTLLAWDDVNVDRDRHGQVVGIEILNVASKPEIEELKK